MCEKVNKALELFSNNYNCAQAVLGVFADEVGIDEKIALKLGGSFGGGMRCGEVCGAVTGALMILGLKYGQSELNDLESKKECNNKTTEYLNEYKNLQGSIICREILGFDVRDKETSDKFSDRKKELCPLAIKNAINLLDKY